MRSAMVLAPARPWRNLLSLLLLAAEAASKKVLCLDTSTVAALLRTYPTIKVVELEGVTDEAVTRALEEDEYQALVLRSANTCSAEMMDAAPSLQVVGRAGIGLDNVDCDAAASRGVVVLNTPLASVDSVAEYTIGLMLAGMRFIPQSSSSLAQVWSQRPCTAPSAGGLFERQASVRPFFPGSGFLGTWAFRRALSTRQAPRTHRLRCYREEHG